MPRTSKALYGPAFAIIGVVALMLVFIVVSTHRNMNRDRDRAVAAVHRQGLFLFDALEAVTRAELMRETWRHGTVGPLLTEIGRNADIAYLYLMNGEGTALESAGAHPGEPPARWRPNPTAAEPVAARLRTMPDGSALYEMVRRFTPFPPHWDSTGAGCGACRERFESRFPSPVSLAAGLRMDYFKTARRSDIRHAVVMAGIVVALGAGALFFLFVIFKYYSVEGTLKETRDYMQLVVDNMADGLLSIDIQGRIVSCNLLGMNLLGLDKGAVRGVDLAHHIDFKDSGIGDTLAGCGPVMDREIQHRNATGETIPLGVSVTPIPDEGHGCRGAVIVLRDLREIKWLEEKLRRSEKLAAIGELAAGVAHEIRNPLSAIRGFAQFLENNVLKERPTEQEYARIMVTEIDRINRVVTDLLTFSRPLETVEAPTDVAALLDHVVRLVSADARSKDVTLRQSATGDLSGLRLDGNQMTHALLNLLLNAQQAVEDGGTIELDARREPADGQLRISVTDDGPGIPAAERKRIFNPFYTTRKKGTGLGLAIVQKITENHHGDIRVESPPPGRPRGCRITLSLPASPDSADKEAS